MSRRTWNGAWLLVTLVVAALVAARYARSFGLFGIVAAVLLVVALLAILRAVGPTWTIRPRPPASPPAPRDVTPRESAVSSSSTISPRPAPGPVVVVETPAGSAETLDARLATLDRLRDSGRLTVAEYEAKRAQLIAEL
jgi:hypothetical protein